MLPAMRDRPLSTPSDLAPLDAWRQAYAAATARAEALRAGSDAEALTRRPGDGRWSAAECVEHLNRGLEPHLRPLAATLARARERGRTGGPPYRRGTWLGRLLLGGLDPERARPKRFQAPGSFRPPAGALEPGAVFDTFRRLNAELEALAAQAEGLPLGRLRVRSVLSPLLRMSVAQAFAVHAIHHHRHLEQAERAVRAPGA
jgi:hypothetical protein